MQTRPASRLYIQFLSVGSGFCLQLLSYKLSRVCTCLQLVVSAFFGGTAPTEDFHLLDSAHHAGQTRNKSAKCASVLPGSMANDDNIGTKKRCFQVLNRFKYKATFTLVEAHNPIADLYIVLGCITIDIIKNHPSSSYGVKSQIFHELDRPQAVSTTKNANTSFFYIILLQVRMKVFRMDNPSFFKAIMLNHRRNRKK